MGRTKAKFDKRKCLSCVYHGRGMNGFTAKIKRTSHGDTTVQVFCDYANKNGTGETCLHREPGGDVTDRRGCDPKNCLLYVEGKAKHDGNNNYCFVGGDI